VAVGDGVGLGVGIGDGVGVGGIGFTVIAVTPGVDLGPGGDIQVEEATKDDEQLGTGPSPHENKPKRKTPRNTPSIRVRHPKVGAELSLSW